MKTSDLINKLYRTTGVDFKAVHNKYKAPLAFGAGALATGALLMPKSEKQHIEDALTRNQERYPEYQPLSAMVAKTIVPDTAGKIIGAGAGIFAAKKGFGKKLLGETLKNEKSVVLRPALGKISDRFGEEKLRMAGGALAGAELGGLAASLPFEVDQARNDYKSGMQRYEGNRLRAGVSASAPWTYNAGLYAADKIPQGFLNKKKQE